MKSTKWNIIGYSVLILLAMALVLSVSHHDNGTDRKPAPQVVFQGEYKIGDEPWQPIVEGKYISAVRGDITLRGRFLQKLSNETALMLVEPNSEIALFLDHIGGEVYINGELNDIFPAEDPHIGKSSCGKGWVVYKHKGTESDTLEIVLKNPHIFGNATAVNELLRSMCIYTGFSFSEEKAKEGFAEWWIGAAVIITALVLIGVAIFSWLTGLDESDVLWLVGIAVLFEGGYLILDAPNANLWDSKIIRFLFFCSDIKSDI